MFLVTKSASRAKRVCDQDVAAMSDSAYRRYRRRINRELKYLASMINTNALEASEAHINNSPKRSEMVTSWEVS